MDRPVIERWPSVSVVMPVRDEERHLADAVAGVLSQDYPGEVEVVLALAPSRDRTEQIAAGLAASDHRVRLVANPSGRTPSGLNAAIEASRHGVVARVDGHGVLSPGYLRRAVELLETTGAANVGGVMVNEGSSPLQQAIARAMSTSFGMGAAPYRVGGEAGPADSVYLGTFRREVLEQLRGYDESLVRAQDWELNYRIRAHGGVVWFSPDLQVTYRPRSSLRALAGQFFRTGQWRAEVVRRHPDTVSPRYLAPPVTVVSLAAGAAAGAAAALGGPRSLALGWALPGTYAAAVLAGSLLAGRGLPTPAQAWLPVVYPTMHLAWGAGFLTGAADAARRRRTDCSVGSPA